MTYVLGLSWIDVGNAAVLGVAATVLGGGATLVLRRRFPPAAHAVLAATAFFLLLVPAFTLASRWMGRAWLVATPAPVVAPRYDKAAPQSPTPRNEPSQVGGLSQTLRVGAAPLPDPGTPERPVNGLAIVLAAWAIGCALVLLRLGRGFVQAQGLRRRQLVAPRAVNALAAELALPLGVPAPRVAESAAVSVPVALGPGRPLILLPIGFTARVSPADLAAALRHELGHLAGRHHLASLLMSFAQALFWWNPLVWLLGRWQAEVQEAIADNFVLATGEPPAAYAQLLLRLAEAATGPPPAVGLAMLSARAAFPRRIQSLLHKERTVKTHLSAVGRWGLVLVALTLGTLAPFVAASSVPNPSPDEPPAQPPQQRASQQAGSFKTESFVNGKPIPLAKPTIKREDGKPPIIIYPGSRSSSGWVETSERTRVAIDEGVEWQGRTAYLSMTFDLLVTDTKTKKTLWSTGVGAFWDTITFENQSQPGEPAQWAVVLKSSAKPEYEQGYELETGKRLELKGSPPAPAGTSFKPRQVWSGSAGIREKNLYQLVSSAEEWTKLRAELFGADPKKIPAASEIDFTKERLLVCYGGKTTNWAGIGVELAVEDAERILLRLHRSTYQSMSFNGKGDEHYEHPYGLIALPKGKKPIVLEYNRQNLIGGPAIWKEFLRLNP